MTTPLERTQAMKFAAEFMRKIVAIPDAPTLLREEAQHILRHYPNSSQIESIAAHVNTMDLSKNLLEPTSP